MDKVRPLWRFLIGMTLVFIVVWISSTSIMESNYYIAFFWIAVLVTWVILSFTVPYDDPVRGMYEIMSQGGAAPAPAVQEAQKPVIDSDVLRRLEDVEKRLSAVEDAVNSARSNDEAIDVLSRLAEILREK